MHGISLNKAQDISGNCNAMYAMQNSGQSLTEQLGYIDARADKGLIKWSEWFLVGGALLPPEPTPVQVACVHQSSQTTNEHALTAKTP